MKNIKFLFLALATLCAGAFTACQEDWNPGPVDSDLSVYMPSDLDVVAFAAEDNPDTEIDETRVATYPLYRQNAGGEMVVEIRSRMHDADLGFKLGEEWISLADAFTFAESVTFAEKATIAYFTVTLDERLVGNISVGEMFGAEIMIKDAKHHGSYGLYRKNVNIGIPESWGSANVNYDPESDKEFTNDGYMYEDFFTWLYSAPCGNVAKVTIEQSESRPGYYRLINPFSEENVVTFLGGIPSDMTVTPTNLEIDATDPENVWIPFQFTGMSIAGFGDLWIGWASNEKFGKLEDGIITFPTDAMGLFLPDGSGWYANTSGKFRIVLPGIDIADYSMGVGYVGSEAAPDNSATNAIVKFSVGADVSKYRFVAVEGKQNVLLPKVVGGTATKVFNDEILKLVDIDFNTYEPADDETLAEAKPNEDTWYMSFDKTGIYTIFAFAYDKNGEPVLYDINGQPVEANVATTYFYYRPTNSEDAVPDLSEYTIKLGAPSTIVGPVHPGYKVGMDLLYSPSFTLACDISYSDINYVSAMKGYFAKKADIEAKRADGQTDESLYESLIASEDADDMNSSIADVKEGSSILTLQGLEPGTEYAMILASTSIYGKTTYSYAEATTAPYTGTATIGVYEFTDGDSKMQIKVAPYFAASYAVQYYVDGVTDSCDGQVYLFTWVGDTLAPAEDAKDKTPIELQFYAMYLPAFDALMCQGQAYGYENYGSLFAEGIDKYVDGTEKEGDPTKYWGYYSSSTDDYEYSSEAMVVYLNESGAISKLATYFKKYYYWNEEVATGEKDENDKDITEMKYFEKVLASFAPDTTTVTLVEDHTPVIVPDNDDTTGDDTTGDDTTGDDTTGDDTTGDDTTGDDTTGDDTTGDDTTDEETTPAAKRASVGVYNGSYKSELVVNPSAAASAKAATLATK